MTKPAWTQRLWPFALVLVGASLLLVTRADHAAKRELAVAREAERVEDLEGAIIAYRRAATWVVPLSSVPDEGVLALQRIAAVAREKQDGPLELLATRAWYSALQSSRWLAVSPDTLRPVAQRLATLTSQNAPAVIGDGRSIEQRTNALQRELMASPQPRPLGMLLTVIGFVCWVTATALLPVRGLDLDHRPTPVARRLGTAIVFGFGLFVLGLALA